MQFWMIDKDPKKNAELLPLMALKTNVREGWQILSDIGHIHGIKWVGQNNLYSASHVCTRSHCVNYDALYKFLTHLLYCARDRRISNSPIAVKIMHFFSCSKYLPLLNSVPHDRTNEQFMAEYLLSKKFNRAGKQQITDEEYSRIEKVANK